MSSGKSPWKTDYTGIWVLLKIDFPEPVTYPIDVKVCRKVSLENRLHRYLGNIKNRLPRTSNISNQCEGLPEGPLGSCWQLNSNSNPKEPKVRFANYDLLKSKGGIPKKWDENPRTSSEVRECAILTLMSWLVMVLMMAMTTVISWVLRERRTSRKSDGVDESWNL